MLSSTSRKGAGTRAEHELEFKSLDRLAEVLAGFELRLLPAKAFIQYMQLIVLLNFSLVTVERKPGH